MKGIEFVILMVECVEIVKYILFVDDVYVEMMLLKMDLWCDV